MVLALHLHALAIGRTSDTFRPYTRLGLNGGKGLKHGRRGFWCKGDVAQKRERGSNIGRIAVKTGSAEEVLGEGVGAIGTRR